jgi:hypothetical protein
LRKLGPVGETGELLFQGEEEDGWAGEVERRKVAREIDRK